MIGSYPVGCYPVGCGLSLASAADIVATAVDTLATNLFNAAVSAVAISYDTATVFTAGFNPAIARIRINGNAEETGAFAYGANFNFPTIRWGRSIDASGGVLYWGGKASVATFWTSAPSDEATIRDYFRTRYGTL